jgi:anti-sigma B factor antagonist
MSLVRAFKLTEQDLRPGCRQIQIEGELDLAVAEQLEDVLVRAAAECRQVVIGLESCEFIDSTGIAVIVRAHNKFAEEGGRLCVYAPSDQVLRILSVTGLTSNGLVFENIEEAVSRVHPAKEKA